ncbi:MAG: DUF664 domain-containing protein [Saprospiraceae bacterium]|nr:DUF664 domain-containing protein [Saprospiraceae bacterium]
MKNNVTRRDFALNLGMGGLGAVMLSAQNINGDPKVSDNINHIGPKKGYTPHIGTLVSMLDWIRDTVFRYHPNLSVAQLDHLHDKDSNTIGALIMHLAATEVIYQDITFDNLDDFSPANKEKWSVAMDLGEKARNEIKGNPLSFYRDMYEEVRTKTNAGLDKRDDNWLLSGETKDWDWNNYCKWFHVVEHYANHRGQITWQAKRLPG